MAWQTFALKHPFSSRCRATRFSGTSALSVFSRLLSLSVLTVLYVVSAYLHMQSYTNKICRCLPHWPSRVLFYALENGGTEEQSGL